MKRKSDYAFVITCNPGYGFGMIASMNAQNYFKTDADWEAIVEHAISYAAAPRR